MHRLFLNRIAVRLSAVLLAAASPSSWAEAVAHAPAKTKLAMPDPGTGASLLQALAGFLGVLAVILVLAWIMRRFGRVGFNSAGTLRVVGGLSMGARERVVLVQAGETQILLGVAPGRVQTLHVLDKPIESEARSGGEGGFADRLREAIARGKS